MSHILENKHGIATILAHCSPTDPDLLELADTLALLRRARNLRVDATRRKDHAKQAKATAIEHVASGLVVGQLERMADNLMMKEAS